MILSQFACKKNKNWCTISKLSEDFIIYYPRHPETWSIRLSGSYFVIIFAVHGLPVFPTQQNLQRGTQRGHPEHGLPSLLLLDRLFPQHVSTGSGITSTFILIPGSNLDPGNRTLTYVVYCKQVQQRARHTLALESLRWQRRNPFEFIKFNIGVTSALQS